LTQVTSILYLEHRRLLCPGRDSNPGFHGRSKHCSEELSEQLINSYSEHLPEVTTGEIFLIYKEVSKGAGAKSYERKP
jgi:hypothetical protein